MRAYLAEFLSDPRVVKLPRWIWLPILHGIVLRTRPAKSAEKYAQIWEREGSPLAIHTARQAKLLEKKLGIPVRHAMRYGEPSIGAALGGLENPLVVALYPQYAESTSASVGDALPPKTPLIESFHDHPAYIRALAAGVRRHWQQRGRGNMLVMSFHGLPKSQGFPYEHQCRATASLLAAELGLEATQYRMAFQSRFGFAEWLQPYTQPTLVELAKAGAERVAVVFPGIVSDCLETVEEIGIVARRAFLAAGGRDLGLVPCLNESPEWIDALAAIARPSA